MLFRRVLFGASAVLPANSDDAAFATVRDALHKAMLLAPHVDLESIEISEEQPKYLRGGTVIFISGYATVSWWHATRLAVRNRVRTVWCNVWWPLPFGPYSRERREARG